MWSLPFDQVVRQQRFSAITPSGPSTPRMEPGASSPKKATARTATSSRRCPSGNCSTGSKRSWPAADVPDSAGDHTPDPCRAGGPVVAPGQRGYRQSRAWWRSERRIEALTAECRARRQQRTGRAKICCRARSLPVAGKIDGCRTTSPNHQRGGRCRPMTAANPPREEPRLGAHLAAYRGRCGYLVVLAAGHWPRSCIWPERWCRLAFPDPGERSAVRRRPGFRGTAWRPAPLCQLPAASDRPAGLRHHAGPPSSRTAPGGVRYRGGGERSGPVRGARPHADRAHRPP